MMNFQDIKNYCYGYVDSKKIFQELSDLNEIDKLKYSIICLEDYAIVINAKRTYSYSVENFILSIVNENDIFKIKATIKCPRGIDEYNSIIPVLVKKLNSKGFDYLITRDNVVMTYHDMNYDKRHLEVNLNNDDNLLQNINLIFSIVNLFNEKVYDKLLTNYRSKNSRKEVM